MSRRQKSLKKQDFGSRAVALLSDMGYWLTADIEVGNQGKRSIDSRSLDLFGIRFDQMFTPHRIAADCSSLESNSDSDQLLRLRGLSDYLSADTAFFIRPKLHPHCRALASKLDIRVLDIDAISQLEAKRVKSKLVDFAKYSHMLSDYHRNDLVDDDVRVAIRQIDRYLSYGFWSVEFHRNLFILIDMYATRRHLLKPENAASIEVAFSGAERYAFCLLEMARSVVSSNLEDLRKQSRVFLHGGSLALRDKERLFSLLRELTGTNEQPDPSWLNDQLELLVRLLFHPIGACDVLRHLAAMRSLSIQKGTNTKSLDNASAKSAPGSNFPRKARKPSLLILPNCVERDVQLILPAGQQSTKSNGASVMQPDVNTQSEEEEEEEEELSDNTEAIILAKHIAFSFCDITGINPELFSTIRSY
ncbi:MAG: hypothetical protein KC777_28735 [Cyanobacteria bacterium HKST-UBA02]|nr:hypothetical protein [Cyanobacteria bacterium HKST-UBA02]